jgi:hypothetical protein
MPYVDLNTIHNPATGTVPPATWGDQVRDNLEFLIDPPATSVTHSAQETTVHNTIKTLAADTENFDNNAMHSTVTNNSRITIQTAGRYIFGASISWVASAVGPNAHLVRFLVNGTDNYDISQHLSIGDGARALVQSGTRTLTLAVSDFVEVQVRQVEAANQNVQLQEFYATFLTR